MKILKLVIRSLWARKMEVIIVTLLFLLCITLLSVSFFSSEHIKTSFQNAIESVGSKGFRILCFAFLSVIIWVFILILRSLTDIYSITKKESAITICQILILVAVGFFILGVYVIFNIKDDNYNKVIITGVGALIGWIFQDTIKGVVAFIHLRLNHQLNIDDWIQVSKHDVDGTIRRVSLTYVTVDNWDTTTSCIPTSILHSEHFVNLKNMMAGKTFGRRMLKTFIFDTNWIRPFSKEDIKTLIAKTDILNYIPQKEMELMEGATNAHIFRIYLFHWLMNHPHISQQPRLVVRWEEHKESGMPLQVYAFITDSSLPSFEWQQSKIIEEILKFASLFRMKLYQSPSSFDVSNNNVYLTDSPASYE